MTILKSKKKDKAMEKRVVGAYLPQPLIQFITLLSLSEGVSVSSLIEDLIKNLIEGDSPKEEQLITTIAWRCIKEYSDLKKKNSKIQLKSFLKDIEIELKTRKLDDSYIKRIIKEIKNEEEA